MGIRQSMLPEVFLDYRVHDANDSANTLRATREMVQLLRASVHRQRCSE
jgi:hypothetical protein